MCMRACVRACVCACGGLKRDLIGWQIPTDVAQVGVWMMFEMFLRIQ